MFWEGIQEWDVDVLGVYLLRKKLCNPQRQYFYRLIFLHSIIAKKSLTIKIMLETIPYSKRLIEVDLPIQRISNHARREKSIRHGHISTLHIWWARRPLAACRAVLCASLWFDPADHRCPPEFLQEAQKAMLHWAMTATAEICSDTSFKFLVAVQKDTTILDNPLKVREALLHFIADFADWDNANKQFFLETARDLTHSAHASSGDHLTERPLVADPFAGGGSIPLEALRVGADAFASDLNPVAVLLNKVVLEYIPKFATSHITVEDATAEDGTRILTGLADAVRFWGARIKAQAEQELSQFYPKDADGSTPIAYLWARTIRCEGPGCGAEVPLLRSLWLAKKANRSTALQILTDTSSHTVSIQIIRQTADTWYTADNPETPVSKPIFDGTVKRGNARCPCCGHITPVARVRLQLQERQGGANSARMLAVVLTKPNVQGRFYRLPTSDDYTAAKRAAEELERRKLDHKGTLSLVPEEPLPPQGTLGFRVQLYGMMQWQNLFTARQLLALTTLVRLVGKAGEEIAALAAPDMTKAVQTCLAMALGRQADYLSSLTIWANTGEFIAHTFGRQALPIVWEFPECSLFESGSGNWAGAVEWVSLVLEAVNVEVSNNTEITLANAIYHPKDDSSVQAFITDPPYYDAVPYADLSDFFYVWMRRTLRDVHPLLFSEELAPKDDECVVDEVKGHDRAYFERMMGEAMREGRRILADDGIGVVVFAHKSTSGWEAQLQAMIAAGWTITASWAIDTERPGRLRAQDSAALSSSIHLVCRPRVAGLVGEWKTVMNELPRRLADWMPRLVADGISGADAIFACLGPALEIFSRYDRVVRADESEVNLGDYLREVWAAVSKAAFTLIFEGADAANLDADARMTGVWLWTLKGSADATSNGDDDDDANADDDNGSSASAGKGGRYVLDSDTADKLAQGIGADLRKLQSAGIVEASGSTARLLTPQERTARLFAPAPQSAEKTEEHIKNPDQQALFQMTKQSQVRQAATELRLSELGTTTLDRVHQGMMLFKRGAGDSLKRFLLDEGVGKEASFWILADALSKLYPTGSEEKRLVDGMITRRKGLGL
jgi:adenine-specific DNA methylase